ncbi:transposase [Candidatus Curtissbacteria bacterium]|nr:transposase [Candidatus Curtissbacteria bacterium]
MPAKNSQKLYLENGYYHIYNRGAGKSEIFLEDQDYRVFTHYLEKYLDHKSAHSLASEVKLLAYCLMPNHFHLFVHQLSKNGMVKLMRSLGTSYSMYFNKRYERSGTLFQGVYKATIVETEPYFLHLSRYIHLNPRDLGGDWREYPHSSYKAYLGGSKIRWLSSAPILDFFKEIRTYGLFPKALSYQSFVEDYAHDSKEKLGDLALD